jgi:dUTP pyrophosphatase
MKVRIKTPDGQPLAYETAGACAFDFKALETVTFAPKDFKLIETGTVVETPEGYVLQISPRSSTFKKLGLIQVNSVGVIDCDYRGDNDTIKFAMMNLRDEPVTVEKGARIGQGMFLKVERADFEVVAAMGNADRGGFGTTGGHGKAA